MLFRSVIAIALPINWRGARWVGNSSLVNLVFVVVPFLLLILFSISRSGALGQVASVVKNDLHHGQSAKTLLALGLGTVLWNYMGWDNTSTFAGEVNDPHRNYPRGILLALLMTVTAYLLPTLAGIAVTTDVNLWSESHGWPEIGALAAGPWLGVVLAIGALASSWSLFNSQLLYVSRLLYAMAQDGWLPSPLRSADRKSVV